VLSAFGTHLRALRESKGYSQEDLANIADISLSQVSRIERGVVSLTLCTLVVICNAMEMSLVELCDFITKDRSNDVT